MQGRAAAGAVRGLQPSIPGRSHAAQAVRARFACTGTSAPPAWCCCCVLACHRARAGALQPSIIGHPCGLTGRQAGPGQASAAQTVGARAWTGPSGPRGTVRRPASGHMRPCERAAATPEAERFCMSRTLGTVRYGALLAAPAIPANLHGCCSIVVHMCAASRPASVRHAAWPAYPLRGQRAHTVVGNAEQDATRCNRMQPDATCNARWHLRSARSSGTLCMDLPDCEALCDRVRACALQQR